MGSGTKRREVVDDSLAGQALVTPARLSGGGIQAPRVPAPQPSKTQEIADALGNWSTERLTNMANAAHERAALDGAIAQVQGETFEQLDVPGADKFMLEGHRVMNAQTASAGLSASQEAMIANGGFELTPDAYRAQLGDQLEMLVDGQDPRTARMIRERMTEAAPGLVAKQMVANANYNEGKSFDSFVQAIAVQSTDTMSEEALLSFVAGGEGSASGMLSQARRQQGIMEGVVLAFVEDNPRAYGLIKGAGLMEEMTTDQLNRIEDAKTQYHNRMENEFNQERDDQTAALELRRDTQDPPISPEQFQDEALRINEEHGGRFDADEARQAYRSAVDPHRTGQMTRWLQSEEARDQGDTKAFATLTQDIVVWVESKGDPNALSPDGAEGAYQVMPATQDDPGYGLRPSNGSIEDTARLGREYWHLVLQGTNHPSGHFPWPPMDLEAAAIAYNAGPGRAAAWWRAGKDWSVLPAAVISESKPYSAKVVKIYNDRQAPAIHNKYNQAKEAKAASDRIVSATAYGDLERSIRPLDDRYKNGDMNEETWLGLRREAYDEFGVDVSAKLVAEELSITEGMQTEAIRVSKLRATAEGKDIDLQKFAAVTEAMRVAELTYTRSMDFKQGGFQGMLDAYDAYIGTRDAVFKAAGLMVHDKRNTSAKNTAWKALISAIPAHEKEAIRRAQIAQSVRMGTVTTLPQADQDLEWREYLERADREAAQIAASIGPGPEADAAKANHMNQRAWESFARDGRVREDYRLSETRWLKDGAILNSEGNVNKESVASIMRFTQFREMNGDLADQFYDAERLALVNVVLDVAGVGAEQPQIAEALKVVHEQKLEEVLASQGMSDFIKSTRTAKAVKGAVDTFYDQQRRSFAQAVTHSNVDIPDIILVTQTEEDMRLLEEPRVKAAFEYQVSIEAALQPNVRDANRLIPGAEAAFAKRTAMIGGSFVYADFNIRDKMFEDKAQNFAKVGIVNEAIIHYMSSLKDMDEVTLLEFLPLAWRTDTIMGFRVDFGAGMGTLDAVEANIRGMPNFTSSVNAKGDIQIRVWNAHGVQGQPIVVPLKAVGDYWMHTKGSNIRNDNKGQPVANPKRSQARRGTIFGLEGGQLTDIN